MKEILEIIKKLRIDVDDLQRQVTDLQKEVVILHR